MISCLLCSRSIEELNYIESCVKEFAFLKSDEKWQVTSCTDTDALKKVVCEKVSFDIICIDLSIENGLIMTEQLRENNPNTFVMVIAGKNISPVEYVKPTVIPAGLMLRPLNKKDVKTSLEENMTVYMKMFYGDNSVSCFLLDSKDGRRFIPYNQIVYFESREKKIVLYTEKEQYVFYDTLDNLDDKLPNGFVRCHRSYIVNKDKISKIYFAKGYMILIEGEMIPVSRTYKISVKEISL